MMYPKHLGQRRQPPPIVTQTRVSYFPPPWASPIRSSVPDGGRRRMVGAGGGRSKSRVAAPLTVKRPTPKVRIWVWDKVIYLV